MGLINFGNNAIYLLMKLRIGLFLGLIYLIPLQSVSQVSPGDNTRGPVFHYVINQWTTENGLVSNNINQVFQSSDGHIWLTTFNGIMRFDGVRFEVFNKDNIPFLNSNAFYTVIEKSDNSLLFSSQASGAIDLNTGIFSTHSQSDTVLSGVRVSFEDSNGKIWIGSNNDGLYLSEGGILTQPDYEYLKNTSIISICEGKNGEIFFGTSGYGLIKLENEMYSQFTTASGLISNHIKSLKIINDILYIGTVEGVSLYTENTFETYPSLKGVEINDIKVSPEGDIWYATETGLARDHNGEFDFFTEDNGLPSRQISSLVYDTEGDLWLSTKKSGLLQLKYSNFINKTTKDGLSLNSVNSMIEEKPGVFLVGSDNGAIDRVMGGEIKSINVDYNLENVSIKDLLIDRNDNLWIASYRGIIKHTKSKDIIWNKENGLNDNQARVLHEDGSGNIWVGFKNGGLIKIGKNDEIKTFTRNNGLGVTIFCQSMN